MTAEIIVLPVVRVDRCEPTSARDAMTDIALSLPQQPGRDIAEAWADDVLGKLWLRGFKVEKI